MIHQQPFHAMGCEMLALLDSDRAGASEQLAQVSTWFAAWEAQLSRFRTDSALSQLNGAGGRWVPVGDVLWEVLDQALVAAEQSDGLVTPTMLSALEAVGYDQTFTALTEGNHAAPHQPIAPATTPMAFSWHAIERDHRARAVRLPAGLRLDFGGVAKGWAADQAAERLHTYGPALIDAGGDIAISGARADGSPWVIGVADPIHPDVDLDMLLLRGGVATLGRDYRRWQQDGVWQHHILDPRTGKPAQTDVLSATVVAPTACEAETAAKTALILGSHAGLSWLDDRPDFAGLLVLDDGQIIRSRRLGAYIAA